MNIYYRKYTTHTLGFSKSFQIAREFSDDNRYFMFYNL